MLKLNELCADLYMVVWTFKEIKDVCVKSWFTELEDEYWESKWICITKNSKVMVCVLTENNKTQLEYHRTLMHELIHAVHYVFDYKWFDLSYDHWTENLAYFMSYYIEQWDNFLANIRKKKWIKKKKNAITKNEKK
jgi:hypothetical protein